jgi:hypothetical protein
MRTLFSLAIVVLLTLMVATTGYVGYQLRESNRMVASIQREVDSVVNYYPQFDRGYLRTEMTGVQTVDVRNIKDSVYVGNTVDVYNAGGHVDAHVDGQVEAWIRGGQVDAWVIGGDLDIGNIDGVVHVRIRE